MIGIECYTYMLEGFLNAMQRISKDGSQFTANCFSIENGIDEAIQNQISNWGVKATLIGKTKLDYNAVVEFLKEHVYGGLGNLEKSQIELLDWQLQEYFGLMSTELNPNGNFNTLVKDGGYYLNIESENSRKLHTLLVKIENYGVLIVVGKRA